MLVKALDKSKNPVLNIHFMTTLRKYKRVNFNLRVNDHYSSRQIASTRSNASIELPWFLKN